MAFAGSERLRDAVRGLREPLAQMAKDGPDRWALWSWDVDGTYWMLPAYADRPVYAGKRRVYEVKTTHSDGDGYDGSTFVVSGDHCLMLKNAKFSTVDEIVAKGLELQHARGNGHITKIVSAVDLGEQDTFEIPIEKYWTVVHGDVIHEASAP